MRKVFNITPCPKPRMTQRDKWANRPPVLRYFAFKDECRLKGVDVPRFGAHIVFHMPMPESWSKKKKDDMVGTPHLPRPDKDNLEKAILDALYSEDSMVWDSRVTKLWAYYGKIEVLS